MHGEVILIETRGLSYVGTTLVKIKIIYQTEKASKLGINPTMKWVAIDNV